MENHAALALHGGLIPPDESKNPHKHEKLRVRVAKLETKLDVHRRESLWDIVNLVSGGKLKLELGHMETGDLLALVNVVPATQRADFLAANNGTALIDLLERLQQKEREKIIAMMEEGQRDAVLRQIPGNAKGDKKEKKSAFEDVVGKIWITASPLGRSVQKGNNAETHRMFNRTNNGEGNDVDRRIAEVVHAARAMEAILGKKQSRLEQLGPAKGKKGLKRIRLLRTSTELDKLLYADKLTSDFHASHRDDRARRAYEKGKARKRRSRKGADPRRLMDPIEPDEAHIAAEPSLNGHASHGETTRTLFGGIDRVQPY